MLNMLEALGILTNLFLLFIIFWRLPERDTGLSSFTNKTELLGSPTSAQKSLTLITTVAVLIYFIIAIAIALYLQQPVYS